jgi:hypothetical protein
MPGIRRLRKGDMSVFFMVHRKALEGLDAGDSLAILKKWRRENIRVVYLKLRKCHQTRKYQYCLEIKRTRFRRVDPHMVRQILSRKASKDKTRKRRRKRD